MSEAVKAFSETLADPDRLVETVVRSVAEAFGDTCMVSLVRGDRLELVALYDPSEAARALLDAEMPRSYMLDESPLFVAACRETVFAPVMDPSMPRVRNRELFARLGVHGMIAVALKSRGETLGIMLVMRHRSDAPAYDDFDRELVEQFAAHAALAVTNSRLVQIAQDEIAAREVVGRAREAVDAANRELEAFSYSVAHDLRAPLRAIDGFSQALLEDHAAKLDADGQRCLARVRAAAQKMAVLIDDLLQLSRITRAELVPRPIDLAHIARTVAAELERESHREIVIADNLTADADPKLVAIVLENLLGNAWKFTGKRADARIEVGRDDRGFFVRDNGAGFDMAYREKLFGVFQRLHADADFAGTGIGLATVKRIVERHGGRVWADAKIGEGATFWFTLEAR
jgi:signal transduction histidine kinase